MATVDKILFLLVCFVVGALAGEFCTKYDSDDWFDHETTIYCPIDCCGNKYDRYCCDAGNAGMVIGIVFGVIALVGVVVTVLVIIFCCCRKTRGATGQVMSPTGVTTMTTTVGQTPYPVTASPYPVAYPYGQPSQSTIITQAYPQQPSPGPNFDGPKPPPYSEIQ